MQSRPRPCSLDVDDGDGGCVVDRRTANATASSSVDRLLADIASQRQRERQRADAVGRRRRRRRRRRRGRGRHRREDEQQPCAAAATVAAGTAAEGAAVTVAEVDDEAASAYWWTDVFLRYFVFDDDYTRTDTVADSDDLLFFVRRRRDKHKHKPSSQPQQLRRPRIVYDTRAYRKQQPRQKPATMLPIGDPAILWPHTVCLNAIVHRFRYTLTVAVCAQVPRKSANAAGIGYCFNIDQEELDFSDGQDKEYDLQLLSRHVHTVYASTSGRRMDAAKGPRERPVYPAVCWAVDDYAEAFRTVIVRPGQTVCAELVAAWPSSATVAGKHADDPDDDCHGDDHEQGSEGCGNRFRGRQTPAPVGVQQKQNRAVLFAGAFPYAAVRAAYECKMSLYREAERQRKRRQQRKRGGGKKSSLGAALSASLTALFTAGKDSVASAGCPSDYGDSDYYYGSANAVDRVEYVTVRGCRPDHDDQNEDDDDEDDNDDHDDDDDDGGSELSSGDEHHGNLDLDDISVDGNAYDRTKGLAQMAVALAPIQRVETTTSSYDGAGDYQHRQPFYGGAEDDAVSCYDNNVLDDGAADYAGAGCYDGADDTTTPVYYHQHHQQMQEPSSSYSAGTTTSEPGDYYDYGWDYETAASSGQQTPQTPSYHYQLQQQLQLERQKRRGGRPRRLSDPCSTSVFDLCDGNCDDGDGPRYQQHDQQQQSTGNWRTRAKNHRRRRRSRNNKKRSNGRHSSKGRRSTSAGHRGEKSDCRSNTADGGDDTENSDGSDSNSGGESNSDDQDSDGEFIGALAAAAAFGHDPDRGWTCNRAAGDPVADWDVCKSDRYSDNDDCDLLEWTTEIMATDLRRNQPYRNWSTAAVPLRTTMLYDQFSWYIRPTPPAQPFNTNVHQQHQQFTRTSHQNQRQRRQPPQLQPQPLEPPPPPPALSVAFTAVACPWWTILEDVLLVSTAATSGRPSSSNQSAASLPLLTFD